MYFLERRKRPQDFLFGIVNKEIMNITSHDQLDAYTVIYEDGKHIFDMLHTICKIKEAAKKGVPVDQYYRPGCVLNPITTYTCKKDGVIGKVRSQVHSNDTRYSKPEDKMPSSSKAKFYVQGANLIDATDQYKTAFPLIANKSETEDDPNWPLNAKM